MKTQNILVFAFKCIYIFAASFALTEWICWHFFAPKLGLAAATLVLSLAATLHALRAGSMILQKACNVGFAWKPYVSVIWLLSFVGAQLFVLGIQGAYTSNEQFYLICGWVVANAVSLALSITMSEQTHAPKSCNSGTCH